MSGSKAETEYDEREEGERRLEEEAGEDEERTFIISQFKEVSH